MPTVVIFITLAIIMAVALTVVVLLPWFRARLSTTNHDHSKLMSLSVEVFKDRISELETDYANGRMDKEAFIVHKTELERQLLQASSTGNITASNTSSNTASKSDAVQPHSSLTTSLAIILLGIPLLMGLVYVLAADRAPVRELWQAQDNLGQVADDLLTGKIDTPPQWATTDNVALVNAIQTNVHHHAYDAQRWMRLSDIYLAFQADTQALEAMSRAYRLQPTDESIAVRYAQTQFFVNGGMLNTDGLNALQQVLKQNPDHQGAQMLMVMGEARQGNYENAQSWIEKLRRAIASKNGDHSDALQSLDELSANIAAQQQASLADSQAEMSTEDVAPASIKRVNAVVKINPALLPLIEPTDILYITIQQDTGGAPLAVKRLPAPQILDAQDYELNIPLSDEDAMMPTHRLSSAIEAGKNIMATARISKSGQAISQSGDLSSDRIPVPYPQDGNQNHDVEGVDVAIEINHQVK